MFTERDERNGLVKTNWQTVRNRVASAEPKFAKLVDALNPNNSYPLYLAYYSYGSLDADTKSTLFPNLNGDFYRLTDNNIPSEIINHLGYSTNNTPLGMVLEKQIECFVDLKNNAITIPLCIYTPGKFFPITKIINRKRTYAPYKLLCSTAGARSVFMLPNIGCTTNHSILQRDFKIKTGAPKNLYDHWQVFKEIANSNKVESDWRCCVLYFSEKWIRSIHSDESWSSVRQYLQNIAWDQCEYEINRVHYDMIFSIIQQSRNLKPNPYLTDTAKHLFTIALGEVPGYFPATNEDALPLKIIQKAFIESYNLKKYAPIILCPGHYNILQSEYPIYYSLQNPSTLVFSPKSREICSTLHDLRELEHIMSIFLAELSNDEGMCSKNSIMSELAKKIRFNYFHNKLDTHSIIQSSSNVLSLDKRFNYPSEENSSRNAGFASDGPFLRGCVRIST